MILIPEEQARADRFKLDQDRIRWSRARSALRSVLARYAGIRAIDIRFVTGQHGKPALAGTAAHADIEFNLSHSGDWALIAVTRSCPVGVDIEKIRTDVEIDKLLRRLGETNLPDLISGLYHSWTRREAKSKAAGSALFDPPRPDAHAADVSAPEGYAASVALIGAKPEVNYCDVGSL